MASTVDICNAALSHIGDVAQVSSIAPPDPSVQAMHCARFYPIARDAILELHPWGFATVRVALTAIGGNPTSSWAYCYKQPADCLTTLIVLDPTAADDYVTTYTTGGCLPGGTGSFIEPKPYVLESLPDGTQILLTNVQNAVLVYVRRVTDPTLFSPLVVVALGRLLGSYIAGPILKGALGRQVGDSLMEEAISWANKAMVSDANQRKIPIPHSVTFINARS